MVAGDKGSLDDMPSSACQGFAGVMPVSIEKKKFRIQPTHLVFHFFMMKMYCPSLLVIEMEVVPLGNGAFLSCIDANLGAETNA